MKRREFLVASAVAAGTVGCSNPRTSDPAPTSAKSATLADYGVQILFHGLNLFAIPSDASKKMVDVGFIDTQVNPDVAKHVDPHVPTLVVMKEHIHRTSNAIPAASDMDYAYYSLASNVLMVATNSPKPGDGWNETPSLEWKNTTPNEANPKDCPKDKDWKNLGWLLDFKELHKDAALPNDWPKNKKFLGVLNIRSGNLETDAVPEDGTEQYTYVLGKQGSTQLVKDVVRCFVEPTIKFVHFEFGTPATPRTLILPCTNTEDMAMASVFNLPTPGAMQNSGPLRDYWALYEGLLTDVQLQGVAVVADRKTLYDRKKKNCEGFTPRSGGCGAVRLSV